MMRHWAVSTIIPARIKFAGTKRERRVPERKGFIRREWSTNRYMPHQSKRECARRRAKQ